MSRQNLTVLIAVGVVLGMLGLAFASKPLYDTFCRITGFGGTTRIADARPDEVLARTVSVRFDSNVNGMPLQFKPLQQNSEIHLGETGLAFYEVTNTSDRPVTAIASYNVTPHKTGPYFRKLECFCFEDRLFQPGETVKLPVVFFVSPDMDEEFFLQDVSTITLSYTFYPSRDDLEQVAALDQTLARN